eukprot:CAMPEP_0174259650 /NCGR_PEP_ID=MMETSP0439-20130205/8449_1 /TAXON_ID=0 /ORGANISM="Stereomyxa ramosa, Strain Chinc5" /LENGTH=2166 /DNA_ID=CAMNT_0015343625 /DNA_START=71 /DNA_END=6571 /DNA_ORIENTATION=-
MSANGAVPPPKPPKPDSVGLISGEVKPVLPPKKISPLPRAIAVFEEREAQQAMIAAELRTRRNFGDAKSNSFPIIHVTRSEPDVNPAIRLPLLPKTSPQSVSLDNLRTRQTPDSLPKRRSLPKSTTQSMHVNLWRTPPDKPLPPAPVESDDVSRKLNATHPIKNTNDRTHPPKLCKASPVGHSPLMRVNFAAPTPDTNDNDSQQQQDLQLQLQLEYSTISDRPERATIPPTNPLRKFYKTSSEGRVAPSSDDDNPTLSPENHPTCSSAAGGINPPPPTHDKPLPDPPKSPKRKVSQSLPVKTIYKKDVIDINTFSDNNINITKKEDSAFAALLAQKRRSKTTTSQEGKTKIQSMQEMNALKEVTYLTTTYNNQLSFNLSEKDLKNQDYNPNHALWMAYCSTLAYREDYQIENVVKNIWGFDNLEVFHVEKTETHAFGAYDSQVCVIAFRGTVVMTNWLTNMNIKTVSPFPDHPEIKVQHGFNRALLNVFKKVKSFIDEARKHHPGLPLFLTGHSLGGALATLCLAYLSFKSVPKSPRESDEVVISQPHGFRKVDVDLSSMNFDSLPIEFLDKLKSEASLLSQLNSGGSTSSTSIEVNDKDTDKPFVPTQVTAVYTFGQPKVGNQDLATQLSSVPVIFFRITNNEDVVPKVPQGALWKHCGNRMFISRDGVFVKGTVIAKKVRDDLRDAKAIHKKTKKGATDHMVGHYLEMVKENYSLGGTTFTPKVAEVSHSLSFNAEELNSIMTSSSKKGVLGGLRKASKEALLSRENLFKDCYNKRNVNEPDEETGMTALHEECRQEVPSKRIIKHLLSIGANINQPDSMGWTPLHVLCKYGADGKLISFLLSRGADPTILNSDNISSLHYLVRRSIGTGVSAANLERAFYDLIDHGADVNTVSKNGDTPLHNAVTFGTNDMIRLLIDNGADIHQTNGTGANPLHIAVAVENTNAVQEFLDRGISPHIGSGSLGTPWEMAQMCPDPKNRELILSILDRKHRLKKEATYMGVTYNNELPTLDCSDDSLNSADYNANHSIWCCYCSALVYREDPVIEYVVKSIWAYGDNMETFHDPTTETHAFGMYNDRFCIISFRGTAVMTNWLTNINIKTVSPFIGHREIKIHYGFNKALLSVLSALERFIEKARAKNPDLPVFLTGHSLGGALANLFFSYLSLDSGEHKERLKNSLLDETKFEISAPQGFRKIEVSVSKLGSCSDFSSTLFQPVPVNGVYTFGQPKVANRYLGETLRQVAPSTAFYRITNNEDIVPKVPKGEIWHHCGQRMFLSEEAVMVQGTMIARQVRRDLKHEKMNQLTRTKKGAIDHMIGQYVASLTDNFTKMGGQTLNPKKATMQRSIDLGNTPKDDSQGVSVQDPKTGETSLHKECKRLKPSRNKIKSLLMLGANPNVADNKGMTPFLAVCSFSGDGLSILRMVETADLSIAHPKDGNTCLHYLARHKLGTGKESKERLEAIQAILKKGANIDAVNKKGDTPLVTAVRYGDVNIVKTFVSLGAKTDVVTSTSGANLLHLCVLMDDAAKLKYLLQIGLSPDAESEKLGTPLQLARSQESKLCCEVLEKIKNTKSVTYDGVTFSNHYPPVDVTDTKKDKYHVVHSVWSAACSTLVYYSPDQIENIVSSVWGMPRFKYFRDDSAIGAFGMATDSYCFISFCSFAPLTTFVGSTPELVQFESESDAQVNEEFYSAVNSIRKEIQEFVNETNEKKRLNYTVFLTGHSIGGAYATIFYAMLLASEFPSEFVVLYTFGQPKVGNQGFVNFLQEKAYTNYIRVSTSDDVVTMLPRGNLWQNYGKLHIISPGGIITLASESISLSDELATELEKVQTTKAASDHMVFQYFSNVEETLQGLRIINKKIKKRKRTKVVPLHKTRKDKSGDKHTVVEKYKVDARTVNTQNETGESPLHLECKEPQPSVEVIEQLLELGADVNMVDIGLWTPLHVLCKHSTCTEAILALVNAGCNVKATTNDGTQAIHYLVRHHLPDHRIDEMHSVLSLLLERAPGLLNSHSNTNQTTPLHCAITYSNLNMVKLLLKLGADINITGKSGASCLHLAVFVQNVDFVKEFLKRGLSPKLKAENLGTPLDLANTFSGPTAQLIIDELNQKCCQNELQLFLKDLGLEKWLDLFLEEEIDMEALRFMDRQMLKELGLPMGPIVKIMRQLSIEQQQ